MLGKSRNELIPFFPILRQGDIRLIPKGMQNIVCGQLPRHEAQFDKRPNSTGQQALVDLVEAGVIIRRALFAIVLIHSDLAVENGVETHVFEISSLYDLVYTTERTV